MKFRRNFIGMTLLLLLLMTTAACAALAAGTVGSGSVGGRD